jgi:hypothetical protein
VLVGLFLAGCKEGIEFIVPEPNDTVIEHLQRQLASTPANKNLEFRRADSYRSAFTYLDAYGKTWVRRVTIVVEWQRPEATRVVIRGERVDSGMFTRSSQRLPELECQVRQKLFSRLDRR